MPCHDCMADRICTGHHRTYNPGCLYCGARILQRIPKFCGTTAEASQRRKAALVTWMALGHAEKELRELARASTPAYEPVKKGK